MPKENLRCYWCDAPLTWVPGVGYTHPGGGLYVVRCTRCTWRSGLAGDQKRATCPRCGGKVRDDHVVLPNAIPVRR